jgi:hypothetical protein
MLFKMNLKALKATRAKAGVMMGCFEKVVQIKPKAEYSFGLQKFVFKFLKINCEGERVPLYFNILPDPEYTQDF